MSDLFLILHKVRNEPAFDIATQITTEDGETLWIIPTSGHRATPYDVEKIDDVGKHPYLITSDRLNRVIQEAAWASWPDHYRTSRYTTPAKPSSTLLAALGLVKPQPPIRRI